MRIVPNTLIKCWYLKSNKQRPRKKKVCVEVGTLNFFLYFCPPRGQNETNNPSIMPNKNPTTNAWV